MYLRKVHQSGGWIPYNSVDGVCEELDRRREAYGISYVTVPMDVADAFAPVVARLAGR